MWTENDIVREYIKSRKGVVERKIKTCERIIDNYLNDKHELDGELHALSLLQKRFN